MIVNGEYYLITCDSYFIANDGEEYRAVWGKCTIYESKEKFGFVPARPYANWVVEVGKGEKSVIMAGCQVHYAVQCKKRPIKKSGKFKQANSEVIYPKNRIYFTE